MKAIDAMARILQQEGTEFMFCFPSNPLIEAGAKLGIPPIMARNERTMINMADAYTRVSNGRRIGVCLAQWGPGVENAFGAIAQAFNDSVPILFIPGGSKRDRIGASRHFDAVKNFAGVTKWAESINDASRVPDLMRRAYGYLRNGRPGPVMLEVPEDVFYDEIDDGFAYRPVNATKSSGDPKDVAAAIRMLLAARDPIIHAGQGVLYAEATNELREFAELVNVPVMTTLLGKSAFPENHPLALGLGASAATKAVDHFLKKADLVFGIGCSFTQTWITAPVSADKTLIQISNDPLDLDVDRPIDQAILGDARLVLQQLIAEAHKQIASHGARSNNGPAAEIRAVRDQWWSDWMPKLRSDEVPINPYRVIWELLQIVDRESTIVTHDSGFPREQLMPFYEVISPRGYVGWGNTTPLGSSLGIALGAKLAAPDKLVVNVMGDAAVGQGGMDFETAIRLRIPILTLVLNNSVITASEKQYPITVEKYGIKQLSGDYAGVARALGAMAERVEQPSEIVPAMRRALESIESGRTAVLEFITKEEQAVSKHWTPSDLVTTNA